MSNFNALVQYTVENISRPIKYIIYKLTEMLRVVDKFVFRTVPTGAASGYATIEQIEGNTVVFNQLVQNGDFSDGTNNWIASTRASLTVTDGILRVTRTGSGGGAIARQPISLNTSHIYYIKGRGRCNDVNYPAFIHFAYSEALSGNVEMIFDSQSMEEKAMITSPTSSSNTIALRCATSTAPVNTFVEFELCNVCDLTAIFRAGNEPSTVAEYEAWLAQNIGTLPYYDYNAGELLSCKMSGMQTEDSSQQTLDTLVFDVTTFTGVNTATNVREVMFSSGMKQSDYDGTNKDEIDVVNGTATKNVDSRAYTAGDESDPDVLTDGTTTYYALATPITYTDLQDANGNPLKGRYAVESGGTEQVLPANTSTPTTVAPTLTTTYTKDN